VQVATEAFGYLGPVLHKGGRPVLYRVERYLILVLCAPRPKCAGGWHRLKLCIDARASKQRVLCWYEQ
jgi:hypothetical protein